MTGQVCYRLLEELALPRARNKSFVVRGALRYFADRESIERSLDALLGRRHAREAMEAGMTAWKKDDLVSHARIAQRTRPQKTAG